MTYTRIYADAAGETHFEAVEAEFAAVSDYAAGVPTLGIARMGAARAVEFLHVPTGFESDWHPIPQRQLIVVMSGELEMLVSDGSSRRFGPGDAILFDDPSGKGHRAPALPGDVAMMAVSI